MGMSCLDGSSPIRQGWEDMKLDFLIAGFARSGTHSVRGNLMEHKEVGMTIPKKVAFQCQTDQVKIAQDELTFNWPARPQQLQVGCGIF